MESSHSPKGRPFTYAFGGPLGTLGIITSLPIFILSMISYCQITYGGLQDRSAKAIIQSMLDPVPYFWYIIWFGLLSFLYMVPLGPQREGLPFANGKKLMYRCNAFVSFLIALLIFFIAFTGYPASVSGIFDRILPLATASIGFAFGLSTYLYRRSFRKPADELSEHGTSGNAVYDFFMGRELNPRTWTFDWKFFCELRPGLIGWVILDLCMLTWEAKHYGSVSPAPVMLTLYHTWYVADALWFEPAVLSTKDIIDEGFGFMLACGDLAWVPFFYSSQTQYLVTARPHISYVLLALSLVLHVTGFWIFRQSNLQKNWYRTNPKDPRLSGFRTIPTAVPNKNLLCGGWWCFVRHPNYLGDLLMAVSWTLTCGFHSVFPWIYCGYMFTLLIHREIRDEQVCRKKYGEAWNQYRARVPWRIFPLIF